MWLFTKYLNVSKLFPRISRRGCRLHCTPIVCTALFRTRLRVQYRLYVWEWNSRNIVCVNVIPVHLVDDTCFAVAVHFRRKNFGCAKSKSYVTDLVYSHRSHESFINFVRMHLFAYLLKVYKYYLWSICHSETLRVYFIFLFQKYSVFRNTRYY